MLLCRRLPRPRLVLAVGSSSACPCNCCIPRIAHSGKLKCQFLRKPTHFLLSSIPFALEAAVGVVAPLLAGGNRCLGPPAFSASTMTLASTRAQCTTGGRSTCVAHSKQHAVTCKATSPQPYSWRRTQQFHRPTPACRAEERSRDSTKTSEAERLKVPDMPPAKDFSRTSEVGHEVIADPASKQAVIAVQFQVACRKKQVHRKHKLVTSQMSSGLYSKGKGSRSSRLRLLVTSRYFRPCGMFCVSAHSCVRSLSCAGCCAEYFARGSAYRMAHPKAGMLHIM